MSRVLNCSTYEKTDLQNKHTEKMRFLKHRLLFKRYFKSRPNSYTIILVELLIILNPIIGTLKLNQWSPRIIKHVVHTL